jgi:hypothetical protein
LRIIGGFEEFEDPEDYQDFEDFWKLLISTMLGIS